MAGKEIDVIVIGGGASGMTAAIACARLHKNVMLLEHNDKIGRKLSATGNGKCNYTNQLQTMECYHGMEKDIIKEVLEQFGVKETLSFFRELGIYPKEKNGYYYPFSEQASAMIEAMRLELEYLKVKIKCKEHIVKVEKKKEVFFVATETYTYCAKKVILATGGIASPKLGSDGTGYEIAKSFGHTVTKLYPALTGLKVKENFQALAGVRIKAEITLFVENLNLKKREVYKELGELQLTAYGISGIPVFQLSRFATVGLGERKNVTASIDFLPDVLLDDLLNFVMQLKNQHFYKTMGTLLNGLLDNKVVGELLKRVGIDKNRKVEDVTKEQLFRFCHCIKEFTCVIIDSNGFDNAQVTAGGVSLLEIIPNTMESKKVKGLYLTGELLDVDGICGGYNLQWAWTTGYLAGEAAGKE